MTLRIGVNSPERSAHRSMGIVAGKERRDEIAGIADVECLPPTP
jgi:hypothetical protein